VSLSKQWIAVSQKWNIYDVPLEDHFKKTSQDSLPQAPLLKDTVHRLSDKIEEAYLRGSFSLGEADEKSDIDLFIVVGPDEIENVFKDFVEFIEDRYDILVHCHDRLVKDYGGIGFMFVLKDEQDQLVQFDLYMALKGVPPKAYLRDCPRVYSSNPDYCWLGERDQHKISTNASKFINQYTISNDVKAELEYQMVDLMVTLNVMKKHLERGQYTRALNDDNHAISICVEMMRALTNEKSVHNSFYAADALMKEIETHPDLQKYVPDYYNNLFARLSFEKVESLFDFGKKVINEFGGDELKNKFKKSFNEYERLVINPLKTKTLPVLKTNPVQSFNGPGH
jgi:predicted nucleotidyltransferase